MYFNVELFNIEGSKSEMGTKVFGMTTRVFGMKTPLKFLENATGVFGRKGY